ncbi:MAG TPA: DUF5666 domain-containing protein [Thermoanaerobaculia bacterium]
MKSTLKLAAATLLLTTTLAPSLLADSRPASGTTITAWGRNDSRRVTVEGRIRDIDRQRNGFVIQLAGERTTLFAPEGVDVDSRNRRRTRVRDLERGDFIRVEGRWDRGVLRVNEIDLLREEDDRRRGNNGQWNDDKRTLSGVVESVNERRGAFTIRDERGRRITVEVSGNGRRDRLDDLRRGERVTVYGEWEGDGRFEADRIVTDDRRRY